VTDTVTSSRQEVNEIQVLSQILALLQNFDPPAQQRILLTVAAYFGVGMRSANAPNITIDSPGVPLQRSGTSFSEDRSISPKEFLIQKQPRTDVERIACLAFYLTHYMDMRFFKTLDISKLNTDAAQVKLSNAAYAIANAEKAGLLAPAQRGQKQLSAIGEQFVLALPDRDAAKGALANFRRRRKNRKNTQQGAEGEVENGSNGQT
jgi:hypothetical protein